MAALIDVAFIVVGGPKLLPKARQAATHLNATSSLPVRIHLVSDKPLPRQPWFELHLLSAMPAAADLLHRNLSKLGIGPSFIYMWKPFLYQLLPLPSEPGRSRAGSNRATPQNDAGTTLRAGPLHAAGKPAVPVPDPQV